MGMKANSGNFSKTKGELKYKLDIQYFASKFLEKMVIQIIKELQIIEKCSMTRVFTKLIMQ